MGVRIMRTFDIKVTVVAEVVYQFKYDGELEQEEVNQIIKTKYHGNVWKALRDDLISDVDCEIVEEVL